MVWSYAPVFICGPIDFKRIFSKKQAKKIPSDSKKICKIKITMVGVLIGIKFQTFIKSLKHNSLPKLHKKIFSPLPLAVAEFSTKHRVSKSTTRYFVLSCEDCILVGWHCSVVRKVDVSILDLDSGVVTFIHTPNRTWHDNWYVLMR